MLKRHHLTENPMLDSELAAEQQNQAELGRRLHAQRLAPMLTHSELASGQT
jgi:hypothetical protein